MKLGLGKRKGSAFEREVCSKLSLWITDGKRKDCLWRSAMSGGRATIHARKGEMHQVVGDICAVTPEGHRLTNTFFLECKHVKKLDIASFILDGRGELANFWKKACIQAKEHMRQPLLIAKENHRKALIICRHRELRMFCLEPPVATTSFVEIRYLDDVLRTKFPDKI